MTDTFSYMKTNYEIDMDPTLDLTSDVSADGGLVAAIDVLAAAGIAAEMVYDGDAEECPHCDSQVLSAAA